MRIDVQNKGLKLNVVGKLCDLDLFKNTFFLPLCSSQKAKELQCTVLIKWEQFFKRRKKNVKYRCEAC